MLKKPDLNKPAFKIFPASAEAIKNNKCPTCGKEIKEEDFKAEIEKREYSISGMCKECQDETFSKG